MIKNFRDNKTDGGGPGKIASQFGLPMKVARKAVEDVKALYPTLIEGLEKKAAQALIDGYVITNNYSKRRILFEGHDEYLKAKKIYSDLIARGYENQAMKEWINKFESQVRRKAFNYPIQSTGADMIKLAGNLLRKLSSIHNFEICILIHDEWVIRCRDEDVEKVKQVVSSAMMQAGKLLLKNCSPKSDTSHSTIWTK